MTSEAAVDAEHDKWLDEAKDNVKKTSVVHETRLGPIQHTRGP